MKEEIKFLYMKKDRLNESLYKAHLQAAREWGKNWIIIQNNITNSLNLKFTDVYKALDRKLSQLTQNQKETIKVKQEFFQRITNLTDISFTQEETGLLNKGLNYNLNHKRKNWIRTLSMEAECAVNLLPYEEQDYVRHRVAKQIEKMYFLPNTSNRYTPKEAKENNIVKAIKEKLRNSNAIVTRADKGNSIVITYRDNYEKKVNDFIHKNGAEESKNSITTKFQKAIRHTLHECKTLINTEDKWKFTCLNPQTPSLQGLMKVHKDGIPIRPFVNYTQAPAYKLAKKLSSILKTHIPLPNAFNIQNSTQLMEDISEIQFTPNLQPASLDISDMYSNIPTGELEDIIHVMCKQQNIGDPLTQEILTITKTVLTQNYYGFKDKTYIQKKGLAMGSPTSSILSEIYLQFLENTKILNIVTKPGIEGYFRYVDDILIVYNKSHVDITEILDQFNNLTPHLNFTLELERDSKLNFLDISLTKTSNRISYKIYRKPTTTDTIIPKDSCHPREHKMAAIRYFVNRAHTYDLDAENKKIELNTIKQIVHNNG